MSSSTPKVLCLFSAPLVDANGDSLNSLDIESEREAIIKELSACNRQITLRIEFATIDALARGIRDHFNILHFSGHGSKEYLDFEDGQGGSHLVDGTFLKKLIGIAEPFDVAMISACYSESIGNMVQKAGARHVIAINRKSPILDQAAIKFAGIFYRQLFANDTVEHSFNMAKILVEGDPQIAKAKYLLEAQSLITGETLVPEQEKFVLIPTYQPVHQKTIWVDLPRGVLNIEESKKAPTNLPARPRSFRGRSKDLYEIIGHLLANRFVTVTGTGGIGKTTATIEVARWFYLRGHFPDGIFVVNLRDSTSSNRIMDLIGTCLNRQFANLGDVIACIRDLNILFLLDNVEDVLYNDEKGTQQIIEQLLKFAPNIKILATSQKPIGGNLHEPERIFRMTVMDNRDSVQLFASTSKRPVLEEELTSKDFRQLMEQLGGHPLSIVIMARQLTHGMTIGELTKRIEVEKAKAIQISGISDRPFEHGESLIATLLSSFENLDQFSKEMFISLSMLPTGAFKPTTENIFGNDAWDVVHKLVDASLGEIASQRITLLPPVRLFAANFLSKSLKRKYAPKIVDYMAHYAQWCYNGLGTKDAILFRSAFELEEPNFRYAVELTTIFKAGKSTHALSKIGLLAHYLMSLYDLNYRENEAISLGYFIVSKLEEIGDSEGLARVLHEIAYLIADKGQLDESKQILEKALEIFNELHAFDGEVNTLIQLGHVMIVKQDFPKAKEYLENALGKVQEWGKKNPEGGKCGEADTYNQFAYLFQFMNDLSKAKQFQEKALKIYQEIGEKMGESASFFRMGYYSRLMNDFPKAKDYLENAVKTAQQIGAKETEAYSFEELGKVFISTNDFLKAKEYLEKALKLCQEIGDINSCEKTKRLIIQIDDLQTGKRS